jgi:hypothetical protein
MPGITPGSVLDLDTGQLHDGPKLDAEWQAAHPDDRLSFLVQQVGALGDVALLENAVLIPGGRYANLGHGNFEAVRGKDLSGLLGSGDVTARIAMGETLLVQMRNGAYALIRYVGRVEGAVFFAYLVQPSGEARFSVARLPSWMELRGRTSAEQLLGHEFLVHQRDIAFWKSYWTMTESLQNVAESPAASQVHRTRARRLLSELRYPTAAQEVPGQR